LAHPPAPFLEELVSALRGCLALLTGQRDASTYFDFSRRGLVGSLIGAILAIGLAGFGPMIFGLMPPPGAATQSVVINSVLFVAQAGTAFLALRQMGRQDGFVPYMVASNWVTLLSALLLLASTLLGGLAFAIMIFVVIVAIVTFVNIGRFIVTLTPIQIGILFLSQAVGVFISMAIIGFLLVPAA
jgi:hypothetical protein